MMNYNKVSAISIAVLWVIVFSVALQDWTLGIGTGLCIAMAFGAFDSGKEKYSKEPMEDEEHEIR